MTDSSATTQQRAVPIAPAPNGTTQPEESNDSQSTKPYTCVTCARRKVKCDKIFPVCTTCRKARLDCEYQEPAPRKRKRKPEDDIYEKLEHYEALLKKNGILPTEESVGSASPAQPSQPFASPFYSLKNYALGEKDPGRLLTDHGKTRYIDSGIWRNLGEHDLHPSDEEDDEEPETSTQYQPTPAADPASSALLGPGSPPSNLISLHPSYDHAMKLWKVYVDNVDPIAKIVHVPSFFATVQRTAANPSTASKASEVLVFAIYHIAVISLDEAECLEYFGESQSKLTLKYHDGVRQALVNAYFLKTTDMVVLQAFILFLLAVRTKYDPHTFWILTGIAMRIGQRMGLHRDGEGLGLKPFDVQIRRRVFWQLIPLDGLAGQLCGTGISINPDSWDTQQPLNINDTDIWPDMTTTPEPRTGATDMMFCLARTELAKFVQKAMPLFGNWSRVLEEVELQDKERLLDEIEEEMETKYLRYCDFADPLHNIVMAMARTAINAGKLRIRLPRIKEVKDLSEKEREAIWTQSLKIIDYDIAAQNNGNLKRFRWHLEAFFQWDSLIWILNDIRRHPLDHVDDQIWSKIEKVYQFHPNMLVQRRALHLAVAQLTLKAWDASHPPAPQTQTPLPEPSFITTLRTFTSKRNTSRANSTMPPPHQYNPFDPNQDASEDLGNVTLSDTVWNTNDFDFSRMADFNDIDWMLWDQLVPATSFPAT